MSIGNLLIWSEGFPEYSSVQKPLDSLLDKASCVYMVQWCNIGLVSMNGGGCWLLQSCPNPMICWDLVWLEAEVGQTRTVCMLQMTLSKFQALAYSQLSIGIWYKLISMEQTHASAFDELFPRPDIFFDSFPPYCSFVREDERHCHQRVAIGDVFRLLLHLNRRYVCLYPSGLYIRWSPSFSQN